MACAGRPTRALHGILARRSIDRASRETGMKDRLTSSSSSDPRAGKMAVCAAWPSLPFINATTDGGATLHKKHTVRLGGAPIEITILRVCGAPLRCKGFCTGGRHLQAILRRAGEDSGPLPMSREDGVPPRRAVLAHRLRSARVGRTPFAAPTAAGRRDRKSVHSTQVRGHTHFIHTAHPCTSRSICSPRSSIFISARAYVSWRPRTSEVTRPGARPPRVTRPTRRRYSTPSRGKS